jgi:hypothetical protein
LANFERARSVVTDPDSNGRGREGRLVKAFWVIDILKDIRQFSEKNGMVELAEYLDDAIFVAAREIGARLDNVGNGDLAARNARVGPGALADHELH